MLVTGVELATLISPTLMFLPRNSKSLLSGVTIEDLSGLFF